MNKAGKLFKKGDRVESLVDPVGEKGTVHTVGSYVMSIMWDNEWRNVKESISHDRKFTNENGTEIFKLLEQK